MDLIHFKEQKYLRWNSIPIFCCYYMLIWIKQLKFVQYSLCGKVTSHHCIFCRFSLLLQVSTFSGISFRIIHLFHFYAVFFRISFLIFYISFICLLSGVFYPLFTLSSLLVLLLSTFLPLYSSLLNNTFMFYCTLSNSEIYFRFTRLHLDHILQAVKLHQ